MARIGYARVSTIDQHPEIQVDALATTSGAATHLRVASRETVAGMTQDALAGGRKAEP